MARLGARDKLPGSASGGHLAISVPSASPSSAAQRHIWGFDPIELLNAIEFPNDKYEYVVRRNKEARMRAIRKQTLHVSKEDLQLQQKLHKQKQLYQQTRDAVDSQIASQFGLSMPTFNLDDIPLDHQLLQTQLSQSAAAVAIQAVVRGWITRRKFVDVLYGDMSVRSFAGESDYARIKSPATAINVQLEFSAQESLINKYQRYCTFFEMKNEQPPVFPYFCAALIQAIWRAYATRKLVKMIKLAGSVNKLTAKEKKQLKRLEKMAPKGGYSDAAKVIQTAWRRYYNRKIYMFYRDLIKFRERGDPCRLLKFINPKEAKLIDRSFQIHVRFRLGGRNFPPTIYYKICAHGGLVDMNAFSPRTYWKSESHQADALVLHNRLSIPPVTQSDGWYARIENNGWRPVTDKSYEELRDPIAWTSAAQKVKFHYEKLRRREEVEKKRRQRKIEWLKKMYAEGTSSNTVTDNGTSRGPLCDFKNVNHRPASCMTASSLEGGGISMALYVQQERPNQHQNQLTAGMGSLPSTPVHDHVPSIPPKSVPKHSMPRRGDLVAWSHTLDFEAYVHDWFSLASTGRSEDPRTFEISEADLLAALSLQDDEDDGDIDENEYEELPKPTTISETMGASSNHYASNSLPAVANKSIVIPSTTPVKVVSVKESRPISAATSAGYRW